MRVMTWIRENKALTLLLVMIALAGVWLYATRDEEEQISNEAAVIEEMNRDAAEEHSRQYDWMIERAEACGSTESDTNDTATDNTRNGNDNGACGAD